LGTWAIGGWMWGGTEEKKSIATIHQALDEGINILDTAPAYGFGKSEEIVGKAIKEYGKRDQIIIATKACLRWKDGNVYRDARKEVLMQEIEDSLRRLQVEYIDLYQMHWPDPLTPFAQTAEVLSKLLKEGKIRAIGVSNFSIEDMEEFQKTAPIHSLQSPYNLFERDIEEKELAYCHQKKIAVLGYGSLCRGLLSGRMRKDTLFKGDDLRKVDPKFQEPRYSQYLNAVSYLDEWVNNTYHRSLIALAIRYCLDKGINIALWGARTPEQLKGLQDIWDWKLSKKDLEKIDKIVKETITNPVGPEFMAPPARA
jgi:aryl-alcohol dehydrogenase-like predicted oxidoreductase